MSVVIVGLAVGMLALIVICVALVLMVVDLDRQIEASDNRMRDAQDDRADALEREFIRGLDAAQTTGSSLVRGGADGRVGSTTTNK